MSYKNGDAVFGQALFWMYLQVQQTTLDQMAADYQQALAEYNAAKTWNNEEAMHATLLKIESIKEVADAFATGAYESGDQYQE